MIFEFSNIREQFEYRYLIFYIIYLNIVWLLLALVRRCLYTYVRIRNARNSMFWSMSLGVSVPISILDRWTRSKPRRNIILQSFIAQCQVLFTILKYQRYWSYIKRYLGFRLAVSNKFVRFIKRRETWKI